MKIEPYLDFEGRCEEALNFYQKVLGAEIGAVMRFSESPETSMIPAGAENKIMHSTFRIGDSTLMASDGNCGGEPRFQGISFSINAADTEEADRLFNALADGGQIQMPIGETFFSPRFGMVADRFGVSWMIIVMP